MQQSLPLALAAILAAGQATSQTCEDRSTDYVARITLCDQAFVAADTNDAAALALAFKGEAQRMLGDFSGAADTLRTALGYTPENAWVWVELGNVRFDEGDNAGAIAHYSAAIAVEDYIDAYANRADSWWSLSAPQRCSDDADQALRIDAQFAYANEVKGRCLIDLGQPEQALGYFDTAIALNPGYQNAYRNKMTALFDLGRFQDVVMVADTALALGAVAIPNPAIEEGIRALRLIAVAQYAPPDQVTAEADALLQRYPQNFSGINIKAMALVTAGRAAEADQITAGMRQNPDGLRMEGAYFDTLAQIDIALGRLEDAFANFSSALEANPGLSKIYAKKLSELGFLPLSNAPAGVLTALRRCIYLKKTACTVAG